MSPGNPDLKREGQIVRRRRFQNDAVWVDEVAFSPGRSPGVHSHDVAGARDVLEGEILFQEADGRRWTTRAGEAYWEEASITHDTTNAGQGPLRLVEVLLKPR